MPTKAELEEMVAFDICNGHWFARGHTPLGGCDFWRPKKVSDDFVDVVGETANFHDSVFITVEEYVALRVHPVVKVGLWEFQPPGPDTADIRYAHRHPTSAGAALHRARSEQGELRAKIEDLQRRFAELRENVLHDPDMDNDTINWALGHIDDALGEAQ